MSSSQVAWKTLTRPATRHEPSLEELLASIIRSIGEDEAANESSLGPKPPAQSLAAPPALRAVPMQPKPAVASAQLSRRHEDIEAKVAKVRAMSRGGQRTQHAPTEPFTAPGFGSASERAAREGLLAVDAACSTLPDIGQPNGSARSVEDLISELRPMLKTWLKDNLPALVERLVRGEIERISRNHVPRRADPNC
jgi:cell pole-organizing protein PopZ